MNRVPVLAALLAPLFSACGDGASRVDAGASDAKEVALPGCPPPTGRVFIATKTAVLPPNQGHDLDGDGTPDNALGLFASLVNPVWANAIAAGTQTNVIILSAFALPPPVVATNAGVAVVGARDVDVPLDPSNNFAGDGEFTIALEQLDAWCQPASSMIATQDGLRVTGAGDRLEPVFLSGTGVIRRVGIEFAVEPDGMRITGQGWWVYPYCLMSRAAYPGAMADGSVLDNGGALIQADIDLDGDGLEQVVISNRRVQRCIDGDGTVIDGYTCPCAPGIADGYSFAASFEGVSAKLVGTHSLTPR